MRDWIRRSFKNRIFITVLLVTLVPMLLCDVFIMQISMRRSGDMLYAQAQSELDTAAGIIDSALDTVDGVTAKLAGSSVIRGALHRGRESDLLYQLMYRETENLNGFASTDVYDSDGARIYAGSLDSEAGSLPVYWGVLRAARECEGQTMQANGADGLVIARAVYGSDGEVSGYVLVRIPQGGFGALLGGSFGEQNDVFLLDGTWRQIYCSDSIRADETISSLRAQLLSGAALGGGDYNVYLRQSPDTGFTLALRQPKVYTREVMATVYSTCAAMGILCLLLGLLCAWLLSRYLSKPVNELDEAMKRVEKGDYAAELSSDREDEMGRLTASFNRMTREYRQNLERSVQRERELNETELSMMQAQLNPHFLYNTLDSIKWLGVTNGVPQVAAVASGLAVLLRAGISGDRLITLERELELLEKYLDIQSLRFEDRFAWEIDVDERFQHCIVPKLILQPLVENSIIHGVANMDDGYIKLSAREKSGTLILSVQDNGVGIPQDVLDWLNDPDRDVPGGHLGLKNVDRIVRLYYGGAYGIKPEILDHEVNKFSLCDNAHAREAYGWVPRVDIETGLSRVVEAECKMLAAL